jgi:hypothetical protein
MVLFGANNQNPEIAADGGNTKVVFAARGTIFLPGVSAMIRIPLDGPHDLVREWP